MKIIAGNFKSNMTRKETFNFAQNIESGASDKKVYIFPATSSLINNSIKNVEIGAQNCYCEKNGAFTGEITLCHLDEFGVKTILIGHSERRNIFGESDEIVAKKFEFFAKNDFEIFFCVGEDAKIRKENKTKEFLSHQLDSINLNYEKLIIAYEPIWAIGTGENAQISEIKEVYDFLKSKTRASVIYGGSVNETNASEILNIADGVLVGSASLDINKFHQIIRS